MEPESKDPYDLVRFVKAQKSTYERALEELRQGKKRSHWIWYVFPQIDGLGKTSTAVKYSIKSLEEAKAYQAHPVLGPRLLECFQALLSVTGKSIREIVGQPDDLKVRSSATLFLMIGSPHSEFQEILDKYYGGESDQLTVDLLN